MRFKTLGTAAVLLAVLAGLEAANAQQAQPKSPAKRNESQAAAPKQQSAKAPARLTATEQTPWPSSFASTVSDTTNR